jgi:hypothetical protein
MDPAAVITPEFRLANYAEAALWVIIGAGFLASAARGPAARRTKLVAALAFIFFGASDAVEASTGAWWDPWWLLVWKGACIATFLTLVVHYFIRKRKPGPT